MKILQTNNIHVSLGNRKVLQNVDLELHSGEMVGLIGPNGAGKSTLMKAIAGLLPYESGEIRVFDEIVSSTPFGHLAKQVAYLPQSKEVHWPLSVRKVVALGRLPHLQPWQSMNTEDESSVEQAMKDADVSHLRDRAVNELAGGERALVMLSRVLAVEPSLILADEPVAGLDPNHQIQAMQILRDRADQGKSVLVVLHDLSLAARFCHKLYLIHEGQILDSGKPDVVLSAENLKKSYGIEAKIGCHEDGFYVIPWRRL